MVKFRGDRFLISDLSRQVCFDYISDYRGITLIELAIVLVIVSIIATLTIVSTSFIG